MEHQLWKAIVAVLLALDNPQTLARFDFSDRDVVKVYYWAVIHDRPTSWACRKRNWPIHLRKRPLPSAATMSRGCVRPRSWRCWTPWNGDVISPRRRAFTGCWTASRW